MPDQSVQPSSFMVRFSLLINPKKPRNQLYSVSVLIGTAILATLCSADDYYSISLWTETNLDWLKSVGNFKNGPPPPFPRHL
jgi:hypothetical protein